MTTIITLFDDNMRDIAALSVPNLKAYCLQWGYCFVPYSDKIDKNRPAPWNKVLALYHTILSARQTPRREDWIIWMDCDSLIMNESIDLENLLEHYGHSVDLVFASDFNGLSTSFIASRVNSWTLDLFRAIYLLGDPQEVNPDGRGIKWEQTTFKILLRTFPAIAERCAILPQRECNVHYHLGDYRAGDFLLHFAVMPVEARLAAMQKMAQCTIPVARTSKLS